jgi:hypothetical protein
MGEQKEKVVRSLCERRGPEKTDLPGERDVSLPQAGSVGWAPDSGARRRV